MRVVIAPDKFKGCLTAAEVAEAVAEGIGTQSPGATLVRLPVADGGDGTVEAVLAAGYSQVDVDAVGPTGEPVKAAYAVKGPSAVVELARVVGLDMLPGGRLDPLGASTYGLGLVLRDAIARGARRIVLGVGGSASTDGGAGMLQALGARLTDESGAELAPGGGMLSHLERTDLTPVAALLGSTRVLLASDVDNPLLGTRGAARVFGPQKGASQAMIGHLEAGLLRLADVVAAETGRDCRAVPGTGAAGGTGFAAVAVLGADVKPGIDLLLELLDFTSVLADEGEGRASLVVTGEGSLDEQSLAGKAPIGVAAKARAQRVPVVAVAGRTELSPRVAVEAGFAGVYSLSDLEPDASRSIAHARPLLAEVGRRIAREWLRC